MPPTRLVFYCDADGIAPVREWLADLQRRNRRAFARCVDRLERLTALGHELRRPHADAVRDGVRELRMREGRVNYRILYFSHGRNVAVLAHAFTKEGRLPDVEIDRTLRRKNAFEANPARHTYEER